MYVDIRHHGNFSEGGIFWFRLKVYKLRICMNMRPTKLVTIALMFARPGKSFGWKAIPKIGPEGTR